MGKVKCFGYSLLPAGMWFLIQIIVAAGFTFSIMVIWGFLSGMCAETEAIGEYLKNDYVYMVSTLVDAVFLIPGFFWFRNLKRGELQENHKKLSWKSWIGIFFLGLIVQVCTSIFLMFFQIAAPEIMESYRKVLESLGMFSPTVFSITYTVVLAPVAEELLFRGMTLKILEKGFPFWAANILQALYFGIIHGNLVQGTYAVFMGMLFGWLIKRYGTLKAPVFCHFVVNLSGVILSNL